MDPEHIEVKIHGKWIGVLDLPDHSCLSAVCNATESPDGYLNVETAGGDVTRFRPIDWRILED